jgi:excisionase family DNA binding protein
VRPVRRRLPDSWLSMLEAALALGVSCQTMLQRVKHGELQAVHVGTGRRKACVPTLTIPTDTLF